MRVDLNADVGESFGAYTIGDDAALMRAISSANIAAGFHAGDPSILRRTVRLAREHGVALGAHPGFPDLNGFGRRELRMSPGEAEDLVLYQIAAVAGIAAAEGVRLRHVKPHGALYNMAIGDDGLSGAIAGAIAAFDARLILFGPPASALLEAGRRAGLHVAVEVFADRAYEADGSLVRRGGPGAVIDDADRVVERALAMIVEHRITAVDGSLIRVMPDTICVHGDTPGAAAMATRLRRELTAAGIRVEAPLSANVLQPRAKTSEESPT